MELSSLLGYIVAGLLFGWLTMTLVEWVWYRGRRRRIDLAMASSALRGGLPMGERDAPPVAGSQLRPLPRPRESPAEG